METDNKTKPSPEYHRGYIAAVSDIMEERYTIDRALYLFAIDEVDCEYQEGYRDALLSIKRYGKPVYTSHNVTYVGFQLGYQGSRGSGKSRMVMLSVRSTGTFGEIWLTARSRRAWRIKIFSKKAEKLFTFDKKSGIIFLLNDETP